MKHRESTGVYVEDFYDWQQCIFGLFSSTWKEASDEDFISWWGVPNQYPVLVTYYIDSTDAFGNKNLQLVYFGDTPTKYEI
jgi:hypothetical protein